MAHASFIHVPGLPPCCRRLRDFPPCSETASLRIPVLEGEQPWGVGKLMRSISDDWSWGLERSSVHQLLRGFCVHVSACVCAVLGSIWLTTSSLIQHVSSYILARLSGCNGTSSYSGSLPHGTIGAMQWRTALPSCLLR